MLHENGKSCLLNRFCAKAAILENDVAVDIVHAIDGKCSTNSIVEMLMDKYQVSDISMLENDVLEFLSTLEKEGFVVY